MTGRLLLPYQARWYALGRKDPLPWRWLEKGRRTGMTWTEAARHALIAASDRASGGRNCIYVSTSHLLARDYISNVAMWATKLHGAAVKDLGATLLRDGADDILAHQVRFESGFTVTGVSSNPAAMRGKGGEACIDETAHHVRLPALLEAAFALQQWGGSITCISTHNGKSNPFNKLGNDIKAGVQRGHAMRIDFMQAVAEGLYRRVCKVNRRPWTAEGEARYVADALASPGADQEFRAIAGESGMAFYRRDLLEACAKPSVPLHLQRPPAWTARAVEDRLSDTRAWCTSALKPLLRARKGDVRHYVGHDFARVVDLSAIAVLEEADDLTLSTPFWIEMRNVPDEEQLVVAKYLIAGTHDAEPSSMAAAPLPLLAGYAVDITEGGGRNLAERLGDFYGRRKNNVAGLIVEVALSTGWYEVEHHRMRARLEERDLSIPRDEDVISDLQSWRINDRGHLELGPKTVSHRDRLPRHGDVGSALLLAQALAADIPQLPKFREMRPDRTRGAGRRSYGM